MPRSVAHVQSCGATVPALCVAVRPLLIPRPPAALLRSPFPVPSSFPASRMFPLKSIFAPVLTSAWVRSPRPLPLSLLRDLLLIGGDQLSIGSALDTPPSTQAETEQILYRQCFAHSLSRLFFRRSCLFSCLFFFDVGLLLFSLLTSRVCLRPSPPVPFSAVPPALLLCFLLCLLRGGSGGVAVRAALFPCGTVWHAASLPRGIYLSRGSLVGGAVVSGALGFSHERR